MNKYNISTIKDIFDKVPADRIEDCCRELGALLTQSARMRDLIGAMAASDGLEVDMSTAMVMPDSIEWVDDGAGSLELHINCEGEELFSLKTDMQK